LPLLPLAALLESCSALYSQALPVDRFGLHSLSLVLLGLFVTKTVLQERLLGAALAPGRLQLSTQPAFAPQNLSESQL
jgi:hypothetical protein